MKASIITLNIIACTALASAAVKPVMQDAKAFCGSLGVVSLKAKQLPQGADLTDVRLCAEHPLGRNRTLEPAEGASLAPKDFDEQDQASADTTPVPSGNPLEERSCYDVAPYGCSGGYCWKACGKVEGDGKWCWTAANAGLGNWRKCTTYAECGRSPIFFSCGRGCVRCGCGC